MARIGEVQVPGGVTMFKAWTTEHFIEKAKEKHGEKFDYSLVEYIDSYTKVKIICPKHGVFLQAPKEHLRCDCPKCSNESRASKNTKSLNSFIEKANIVHNNFYKYSKSIYKGSKVKLIVTCPIHGDFEVTPDNHLHGRKCPDCAKEAYKQTNLERYGVEYPNQSKEILQKTVENNLKKYGVPHPMKISDNIEKVKNTNRKRYNVDWPLQSESFINNMAETNLEKYGVENPMLIEVPVNGETLTPKERMLISKREKGTLNSSSYEEIFHEKIKEKHNDVERNYDKDKRYPFLCDFYIPEEDLFIELNLHWTHGSHWFDPKNDNDILKLKSWLEKSKFSDYYKNAVKIWTERDPLKHKVALDNGIKYVVLWTEKEAEMWLNNFLHK